MRTLIGPMVCKGCRAHVWLVRRKVAFVCSSHGRVCSSPSLAPMVVTADGTTHVCEHPFGSSWYDAPDGSSVTSSDTIGDGRVSARPRNAAVPCLEV
jgi:hypothetical protein